MTLLKLKCIASLAIAVSLAAGGIGVVAVQAGEQKPARQAEKPATKPAADQDKPKPAQPDKPRPEGEKPQKPNLKFGGKVASVDAKERTITLAFKGDGGIVEKLVKVAGDAKILIDGKEGKLADVPKNSTASFVPKATKEGELPEAAELRVTGSTISGPVKDLSQTTVTLAFEKADRTFKLAEGGKITVNGQNATFAHLKVGERVTITLTADESAALAISAGGRPDGEKPGVKPVRFGGKVASIDTQTRIVTLAAKGEGGDKQIAVKVTEDAKIVVDGKEVKLTDLPKGVVASFVLSSARDGQPRESNQVTVAGPVYSGTIKQVDSTSVTIATRGDKMGGAGVDRVIKLAPGGKVTIGEKEAKFADLQAGQAVTVTMAADESAAIAISVGKKPKPDKEEDDDIQ
jgi:hypothetical protein